MVMLVGIVWFGELCWLDLSWFVCRYVGRVGLVRMALCWEDYPGSYVGIFVVYSGLYALVLVEFAYYYVGYSDPKSSVFMLGGLPQFL